MMMMMLTIGLVYLDESKALYHATSRRTEGVRRGSLPVASSFAAAVRRGLGMDKGQEGREGR